MSAVDAAVGQPEESVDLLADARSRGHSAVAVFGIEDRRGRLAYYKIEGRDVQIEATFAGANADATDIMAFEDLPRLLGVTKVKGVRSPPTSGVGFYVAAMFNERRGMSGLLVDQVGDAGGLLSRRTMPDGRMVSDFLRRRITRFAHPAERKQAGRVQKRLIKDLANSGMPLPVQLARNLHDRAFDRGAAEHLRERPLRRGPADYPLIAWALRWPDVSGWVEIGNLVEGTDRLGPTATKAFRHVDNLSPDDRPGSREVRQVPVAPIANPDPISPYGPLDSPLEQISDYSVPDVRDTTGETATALADRSISAEHAIGELGGYGLRAIDESAVSVGLDEEARIVVMMGRMGYSWAEIGNRIGRHWTTAKRRYIEAEGLLNELPIGQANG